MVLFGAGVGVYLYLASGLPEETKPLAEKKQIKTRVAELHVTDYQVQITTQGIVQPINTVTLSAQVGGQIVHVSPQFEVGAYFAEGDVLLEVDARDYRTAVAVAEASLLSAQSARDLAKLNHQRTDQLFERKGISEAEVNQSAATLAQAAAAVDSASADLDQAKRDLERTSIVAPFAGRVRAKNIGLGHSVGVGMPLGIVFAVDYAEVRLPIANRELQYLTLPEHADDEPVTVELRDAISKLNTTVWNAEIVRTEGTLDQDSLELFAIARILDPFGLETGEPPLRIGQPVRASIAGAVLHDVVKLPRNAVRQMDKVNLVDRNDLTLIPLTVNALWSDEDFVVVAQSTLQPDTLLAITPIVYAVAGAKVEVIPDPLEPELTLEETAALPAKIETSAN